MRGYQFQVHLARTGLALWVDIVRFMGSALRGRGALVAENLFLRKQPVLHCEGR